MIKTHGLSHVALSVLDPERSLAFYQSVFGVREYVRSDSTIQVLGPGQYDVLAFEKRPAGARVPGGIIHFGYSSERMAYGDYQKISIGRNAETEQAVFLRAAGSIPEHPAHSLRAVEQC